MSRDSKNRTRKQADSSNRLKAAEPAMSQAMILICEKCGKKLGSSEDNPARQMQKDIKSGATERFGKGQVRAVLSKCMDICPKGKIAACVIPIPVSGRGSGHPKFVEFETDDLAAVQDALFDLV